MSKTKRIEFMIGQGFDRDHNPLVLTEEMGEKLAQVVVNAFGGFTAYEAHGVWKSEGRVISEPALTVVVYTDATGDEVAEVGQTLGFIFNQSCVAVGVCNATVAFVDCPFGLEERK